MKTNQDVRWIQRLSNFSKALSQLESAVNLSKQRALSELEQQGVIQSFEYTHELGWNVLRDYLKDQGVQNLYGSKDSVRAAFAVGLIEDGEIWMNMIRDRYISSHNYNLKIAKEIVNRIISSYFNTFKNLLETLNNLANEYK